MYNLIEYFEGTDNVKWHIVASANTEDEINKIKISLAKELNNFGIETLEVITIKEINSLKGILKRDNLKIFHVVKMEESC